LVKNRLIAEFATFSKREANRSSKDDSEPAIDGRVIEL